MFDILLIIVNLPRLDSNIKNHQHHQTLEMFLCFLFRYAVFTIYVLHNTSYTFYLCRYLYLTCDAFILRRKLNNGPKQVQYKIGSLALNSQRPKNRLNLIRIVFIFKSLL